jgi:hypothetical protein
VAFAYYARLSARNKAIYRRSDAVADLPLPDAEGLAPTVAALRSALARDERGALQRASARLAAGVAKRLGTAPCAVQVLARRPSNPDSELHGLYLREADGRARISVWMRTAANERPVAFRTYLRTLVHELCHHLDFELLALEETFHTEGFYRRESSLARQLFAAAGEPLRVRSRGPAGAREPAQGELFPITRRAARSGVGNGTPERDPDDDD